MPKKKKFQKKGNNAKTTGAYGDEQDYDDEINTEDEYFSRTEDEDE